MPRISKDPETRRRELIEKAERLFLKKGYDETTISDIVNSAGVAQGTFYYYFKTKDDILDAIAETYVEEVVRKTEEVAARQDLNALEKMLTISSSFTRLVKDKKGIVVHLHEDKNAQLHVKIERKTMAALVEPYAAIIRQGIREGLFQTDYPEEAVISIIASTSAILDTPEEVAEIAETGAAPETEGRTKRMKRNMDALFDIVETILGAKKGSFEAQMKKARK
jgi:AcrR family transcriptional regulator